MAILLPILILSSLGFLGCSRIPDEKLRGTDETDSKGSAEVGTSPPPPRALEPPLEDHVDAQKLRDAFIQSYQWDATGHGLVPVSSEARTQFQDRFKALEARALGDATEARRLNRLSVLKYFYWSASSLSAEERGYFFRLLMKDPSEKPPIPEGASENLKNAYRRLYAVQYGEGAPDLQREVTACQAALQTIPRNPQHCDITAQVRLSEQSPDPFDNFAARHRVLERMEQHYARFYRLDTAQERLKNQDTMLESTVGTVLFSGAFGPTWSEAEMDEWLKTVEGRVVRRLDWILSSKPLSLANLDQLNEPVEVIPKHLPIQLQELARSITFPSELSMQLGLKASRKTLWDFISQNLRFLYLTSRPAQLPDSSLLGQMYSPFLQVVMVDIGRWKNLLGKNYLAGVLSTLAHEAYHVYYRRKLIPHNPELVRAVLLDERNGHLMSALVLERLFPRLKASSPLDQGEKNAAEKIAAYFLDVYGANAALGFPLYDETFKAELPPGLPGDLLAQKPEKQLDRFFKQSGTDLRAFARGMFARIQFNPAEFSQDEILLRKSR